MIRLLLPLICYVLLIVYGSLYPFTGWRWPDDHTAIILQGWWPQHISRGDLITNLLAYFPLGYLLGRALPGRLNGFAAVAWTTVLGTFLSAGIEVMQIFLPQRQSSLSDIVLNSISTLIGAFLAWGMGERTLLGGRLRALRREWFLQGRLTDIGLAALGLWALSQLVPLVPSLDVDNLKEGLKPLWYTLHGSTVFNRHEAVIYALNILALGGIVALVVKNERWVTVPFAMFASMVLLLKIPVVGRQISLEAIAGLFGGLILLCFLRRLPRPFLSIVAATAILAAFVIDELRPAADSHGELHVFNWVPFSGQMVNVMGLASIIEELWPFTALAFLTLVMRPRYRLAVGTMLGLLLAVSVFALEWAQQQIPGRYPDVTSVLLAVIGWTVPWLFVDLGAQHDLPAIRLRQKVERHYPSI